MNTGETDWKEEFRRQVTEGITPRSKFVVLNTCTIPGVKWVVPSADGLILTSFVSGTMAVRLMNISGEIKDLLTRTEYRHPVTVLTNQETREVILQTEQTYFNASTGSMSSIDPREQEKKILQEVIRDLFTLPEKVTWTREVTQFRSKPGRKFMVYDDSTRWYYIVCTGSKIKKWIVYSSGSYVSGFHCYKDVVYNSSLWEKLVQWSNFSTSQVSFSGMHFIMTSTFLGILFFYNLESKVFTLLDVATGRTYSEKEFFNLPGSFSEGNYDFSFNTVGGLLYILVKRYGDLTLISYRF